MKTLILVEETVILSQSVFLLSYTAAAGVDFLSLLDRSVVRGICINPKEFWEDIVIVFRT